MSHTRTSSEATVKTPHSVSLKVLRLSRPTLSQQTPLPPSSSSSAFKINPAAALASRSLALDSQFILSPLLGLPSSFGTLHVGETFTGTLCVNNEILSGSADGLQITGVRITAELTTPSDLNPVPIDLDAAIGIHPEAPVNLGQGETLQRVLRYYLREEGNHVLAVTVTYTETTSQPATGGRVRTFRKLYQFAAQSLMGIRTKIRVLPSTAIPDSIQSLNNSFALEAQLENFSDGTIVLEEVEVIPRDGMRSMTLNAWEMLKDPHQEFQSKPTILPGDVMQVAYILSDISDKKEDQTTKIRKEAVGLCQLHVRWRAAMGEEGALTTAWLGGKRR